MFYLLNPVIISCRKVKPKRIHMAFFIIKKTINDHSGKYLITSCQVHRCRSIFLNICLNRNPGYHQRQPDCCWSMRRQWNGDLLYHICSPFRVIWGSLVRDWYLAKSILASSSVKPKYSLNLSSEAMVYS